MSKVRLVVVGNGMVGHCFIELIEQADPGRYEITRAEPRPAYDRVHLSSHFSPSPAKISPRRNPASTTKHGIRLLLGEAVKKSTGPTAKCTPTRALWSGYDKAGAGHRLLPWVPPIAGSQHHESSSIAPSRI